MYNENRGKLIDNILKSIPLEDSVARNDSKRNFFQIFCLRFFFTLDVYKIISDKSHVERIISFIESVYQNAVKYSFKDSNTEIIIDERDSISILTDYSYIKSFEIPLFVKYNFVLIMNKDMPFLVNSYMHCLKKRGYIVHYRMNIVLPIFNNKQPGEIGEKYFSNKYDEGDLDTEVYTLFLISRFSEDNFEELRKSLLDISSLIYKVNDSYFDLEKEFPYLINNIENYNGDKELKDSLKEFYSWFPNHFSIFAIVERKFDIDKCNEEFGKKNPNDKNTNVKIIKSIGILDHIDENVEKYDCNVVSHYDGPVYITRLEKISDIHRDTNIDCVRSKIFDENSNIVGEHIIYGLFSSKLAYIDPNTIPIIDKKIRDIVRMSSFIKNGFNEKALMNLLAALPRIELFHIETAELFELAIVALNLFTTQHFRLFTFKDKVGMYLRVLLFIPNKNFNSDLQQFLLERVSFGFRGKVLFNDFITNNQYYTMMQIIMKVDAFIDIDEEEKIEEDIAKHVRDWQEELQILFLREYGKKEGLLLLSKYLNVFPIKYRENFSSINVLQDVNVLESKYDQIANSGIVVDLNNISDDKKRYSLNIFTIKSTMDVSEVLPILKNMYMDVRENEVYKLNYKVCDEAVIMHHFIVECCSHCGIDIEKIKDNFEDVFLRVKNGIARDNLCNALVSLANLNAREIMLMNSFISYLQQINSRYSEHTIQLVFVKYFDAVVKVLEFFDLRFNPNNNEYKDEVTYQQKKDDILNFLNSSYERMNFIEDKIFRAIFNLVDSIVRTNYYLEKDVISYKINSAKIEDMPLPKPLFEIFVFSKMFKGIHLRSGKVARGGIRWSDRSDDLRTEILGLVKAQTTKNVTIIPVGAKGGFVLSASIEGMSKKEYFEMGVNAYKNFLRGLLDITDNLIDNQPMHPEGMRVYDDYDPYLVVAADKGTAKFSDYANDIANEYSYWLGDAFASGGSSGYDHKKIGITTKGAFESVKCHFWSLNKNIEKESFTTIAIGDLAGDVFGNAMILTSNLKLIAAFNHSHIFIDPNPNQEKSFEERKRVFALESSTWEDYDKSVISDGGGVFSRSQKKINISQQMKFVFDIQEDELDTNELIKKILKSNVDLIWNGGIGTFVKSVSESNDTVGDKSNDLIRVNGEELRAKVFGEGGNLGCTQLGRIEYANSGGLINTDSVDNTAGVCCSDYEVNIKILFFPLLKKGDISYEERNTMLAEMENDIRDTILNITNKPQAILLLRESNDAKYFYARYQNILNRLENAGLLNRKIEFLPYDSEIAKMKVEGKFFVRPHLAVIMAYTKMYLYEKILSSDIFDDQLFISYLFLYFPNQLSSKFSTQILSHPLKKEIISTIVVNIVVNRLGCTFVNSFVEGDLVDEIIVIKIIFIIISIYNIIGFWVDNIEPLIGNINVDLYIKIESVIRSFATSAVEWFLRNEIDVRDISGVVDLFGSKIEYLMENFVSMLDSESHEIYNHACEDFDSIFDEDEESAKILLAKMSTSLDVLLSIIKVHNMVCANSTEDNEVCSIDILLIGKVYFEIGKRLKLNWLIRLLLSYNGPSISQSNAINIVAYNIISCHINIVYDIVLSMKAEYDKNTNDIEIVDNLVSEWIEKHSVSVERFKTLLADIDAENLELDKLIVLQKRIEVI